MIVGRAQWLAGNKAEGRSAMLHLNRVVTGTVYRPDWSLSGIAVDS